MPEKRAETSDLLHIESGKTVYTEDLIEAKYEYHTSHVEASGTGGYKVVPQVTDYTFRTERKVPKLGVMLVGWGGNNGTTVTGAVIANRLGLTWPTKSGGQSANYFGSLTQCSTTSIGRDKSGKEIFIPLKSLLPMTEPNDIVFDGWDISSMNLGDAMNRAQVFDIPLQTMLYDHMAKLKPRPSIFDLDFVAPNQADRADNVLEGTKWVKIQRIRKDIQEFKAKSKVDKVIVLWTANTERFCDIEEGLNDTWENLNMSIEAGKAEISPSTMFAVASILEGCSYINGSPQNTFVPGVLDLAEREGVFVGGDDFKSGQTKIKSVLVDFLISAGLKPASIVSYNHLGNNDGKNLSFPLTFRSKEISKSNVVDDMVESNHLLYEEGEKPDHCIVIKYIPYVGDSKRAMDEYTSEIMMGGKNTIAMHNTCEDSLLASPLILDLIILTELCERITFRVGDSEFQRMHSVLSVLSILLKAPVVPPGAPVVNAFFKQRACIENILRACLGMQPESNMLLEFKSSGIQAKKSYLEHNGPVTPVAEDVRMKKLASLQKPMQNGHSHATPNGQHEPVKNGHYNAVPNGVTNGHAH